MTQAHTIPEHMQAVICEAFAPTEALQIQSIATPTPKPNEVLIKVDAAGVNFPDSLLVQGLYQIKPELPFIPGCEVSGEIVALGDKVPHLKLGTKVIAWTMLGGFAQYVSVNCQAVMPLPEGVDMQQAAGLLTAHATAHHGLKQRGQLQSGDTVLVTGAAGGTGSAAIQIAKQMGATVIAACSTPEKEAFAVSQGADHTINTRTESIKDKAKALTNGKGVDVVYECVGGDIFKQCISALGFNGRLLVVGFASGDIPQFAVNLALVKGISVVGVFWGSFTQHDPATFKDNMMELMTWFALGKVRVDIDKTYALDEIVPAMAHITDRKVQGKVVIGL